MQGPVAAAIPTWQASVSFINRPPGPRLSESGSGHFRQIETLPALAACPLWLRKQTNGQTSH